MSSAINYNQVGAPFVETTKNTINYPLSVSSYSCVRKCILKHSFGSIWIQNMTAPTSAQIEALFDFLEEHRDLARGNLRSVEGRVLTRRLWDEISSTLNAMGGCTKTVKQWQKVWTDKKYLAKKAAAAVRRSALSTGGGPSTAPPLSQWESKVISIMGDGFGEPQTTARVPAFIELSQELSVSEPTAASLPTHQEDPIIYGPLEVTQDAEEQPDIVQPGPRQESPVPRSSTRQQRRRRGQCTLAADRSVRNRLFQLEEQRVERERQSNEELAGIKMAVLELCSLMRQLIEQMQGRNII